MKNCLLLMTALGIGGLAHAQTSVTLFGTIDTNVTHGTGSVSDRTQMGRSGLNSSRLGFRGREDLGGGTAAGFWLEAGFNSDDGTGQASNANNQTTGAGPAAVGGQGLTFARRSTVSLFSSWGEVRLGRDYNPQYLNYGVGEPFAALGLGTAVNYQGSITPITLSRSSNMLMYFSPTWSGLNVSVAHYRGENASNVATRDDGTGNGIRVNYAGDVISAGLALARTEYAAGDTEQRNAYVGWISPIGKLTALYSSDRNGALKARGGVVGISTRVGGSGTIKAAYSVHRTSAAGTPQARKLSIGYVYDLSKRTALYGTAARVNNSNGAAIALAGAVTGPSRSSSGLELGIRHSF